ncbi:MAG TPA: hypothetical protein VMT19_08685 [Thermoanaerobaculaceae bacterium]|nr:hypothetical protein [Thermoanaerobaculaceae bacterium]
MDRPVTVAVFVSPHGFGHAARACAVMQALADLEPSVRFEVFTLVPEWFFRDSLACRFRWRRLLTDVGLAQATPLVEDLDATLAQLSTFLPFSDAALDDVARVVSDTECALVIADISPLGIAAARRAGVPSVLIENFTWDWIYERYLGTHPAFRVPIEALAPLFAAADLRLQTEPVCRTVAGGLTVAPVSRAPRSPRDQTRSRLGVDAGTALVLVTMGGVPWRHTALDALETSSDAVFVVPGASEAVERRGSLLALPNRSGFFHPDLVAASDAVVGKLGYSTLAECYGAGVPFAYATRGTFRESGPLAVFVADRMRGMALAPEDVERGTWPAVVPALLALRRLGGARENGATAAARLLLGRLRTRTAGAPGPRPV